MSGDAVSRLIDILRTAPVIPVLTIRRLEHAVPLAKALVRGGLPVLEITLRSDVATAAIGQIRDSVREAIVGAGTILNTADFTAARDAGAMFGVSPGLTAELAAAVAADRLPFLPGVATASEVMHASSFGFRAVKFFPAEAMGGRTTLASFAGPFRNIVFCPTGGIREETLESYLRLPNVVCVGGSWMAPDADVDSGRWEAIAEHARRSNLRGVTA